MQETRRQILDILKTKGMSTVDELVVSLREVRGDEITAVTIRHHLGILQEDDLVDTPEMRHRSTPGRPQHIYALTEKGLSQFPTNYQRLAAGLLVQMKKHVRDDTVNVIIEGIADDMAREANIPDGTLEERLEAVVTYLNTNGYEARWEANAHQATAHNGGYILYMCNCPYHHISQRDDTLCQLDMQLISNMLGVVPRLLSKIADDDTSCSYLVPERF